ncbi:MAG: hypothetical protein ACYCQK_01550 [Acidiferrobacteraceae bacterium]
MIVFATRRQQVHVMRYGAARTGEQTGRVILLRGQVHYRDVPSTRRGWRAEVRSIVANIRHEEGLAATRDLWRGLCAAEARKARLTRTARGVLRLPDGRAAVYSLGARRTSVECDFFAPRKVIAEAAAILAARRARAADRRIAEAARAAASGRILSLLPAYRQRREAERVRRWLARCAAGRRGRAGVEQGLADEALRSRVIEAVGSQADDFARAVVRAVGTLGPQTERDLGELHTGESFGGTRGRHHRLTRTTISRVEHLRDWSACLLTIRHYASFGRGAGGGQYESRGGSSFRAYLVVRDASSGEAHVLRVPPKFGNPETQFFAGLRTPEERIRAAAAWTFGVKPHEYAPRIES